MNRALSTPNNQSPSTRGHVALRASSQRKRCALLELAPDEHLHSARDRSFAPPRCAYMSSCARICHRASVSINESQRPSTGPHYVQRSVWLYKTGKRQRNDDADKKPGTLGSRSKVGVRSEGNARQKALNRLVTILKSCSFDRCKINHS